MLAGGSLFFGGSGSGTGSGLGSWGCSWGLGGGGLGAVCFRWGLLLDRSVGLRWETVEVVVWFFGSLVLEDTLKDVSVRLFDISGPGAAGSGPVKSMLAGSRRRATFSDGVSVFLRFAG